MAMRPLCLISLIILLFLPTPDVVATSKNAPVPGVGPAPFDLVDPFIGTGGFGHTYPGATLPFGMVQLSPDTRTSGWENCSGYHASNPTILGFSHTHLSGTGATDLGDILFMPTVGPLQTDPGDESDPGTGYRSSFSHDSEHAEPGYYKVVLDDYLTDVELTTTARVGFHKYTFPTSVESHVIVDLTHGISDRVIDSGIEILNETEITGFRRSRGWARDHTIYFAAVFSKPFASCGTVEDTTLTLSGLTARGTRVKAFFDFVTSEHEPILVKVGISPVSIDGARNNLDTEIPHWEFDDVRSNARTVWSKALSTIKVEGGSKHEKINFYTALYHTLICPNLYTDVDGRYRGVDGQIHTAKNGPVYTVFSLWDTFRATHPLYTIIAPEMDAAFVRSMLLKYDEGGHLPVWELHANETNCMIGYHSIPVIADAYAKGIRDFDAGGAFFAMKKSADRDHRGLEPYRKFGYIPNNLENESVSKTLEYAYDDWCIAEMARLMGRSRDHERYRRRAKYYANVFDASTGFMRAKQNGSWVAPFDPNQVSYIYTEATAWQYRFFAPHDIEGLIDLMGGDEAFVAALDSLFTTSPTLTGNDQPDISGLIGQYAHGNEPSHHVAYLYNYAGSPWKTQRRVREIMDELYKPTTTGLCGNEDCGQMSAWYVFSAMGFYPVCPGSDQYAIGSPIFDRVEIDLGGGRTFAVAASNEMDDGDAIGDGTHPYIHRARLNNRPYSKSFITHGDIVRGGVLELDMGAEPNTEWAAAKAGRPTSSVGLDVVMNPFFTATARSFRDTMTVAIGCYTPDAEIFYTTDGRDPSRHSNAYAGPIVLEQTTTLKAIAFGTNMEPSIIETADYIRIPHTYTIEYDSPYHRVYNAGGDNGLLDGIRAEESSFADWQGFLGVDLSATIDLGEVRSLRRISAGFLQKYWSWIFLPSSVEFSISADGKTFKSLGVISNDVPVDYTDTIVKEFTKKVRRKRARYVRITATNIGVNPPQHPGAGHDAFIFADEITIE